MPRRRIPHPSIPGRPDSRRKRGNATGAQRRPGGGRRGQLETIVERRIRAFELRKRGATYRQIAQELHVDVHTIHGDIQAELASLRETAVGEATQLRALELERLDGMTSGLWPHVRAGSAPAVTAAVKVSERRARLLGLDAATTSRTEVSGSLSVEAQARYKAEAEELRWLDLHELEELADQSQKMIDDAIARSRARRNERSLPAPSSPAAGADDFVMDEPTGSTATNQREERGGETGPRDMP